MKRERSPPPVRAAMAACRAEGEGEGEGEGKESAGVWGANFSAAPQKPPTMPPPSP